MTDWNEAVRAFPRSARKHMRKPPDWEDSQELPDGYRMWMAPNVPRGYLLEDVSGKLTGWEMTFDPKVRGKPRAEMCDLCNFVHGGSSSGVTFFSIPLSKQKTTGLFACRDLGCDHRCAETGVNAMRESLTTKEKRQRLQENILDLITRLHSASDRQ